MPVYRPRRPLVLAVAAAAVLPLLLAAAPATAEEAPAPGETVVGELVQGYADPFPSAAAEQSEDHVDELVSWIETPSGEAVRVPTEDVEDIATGSTVEVTVGAPVQDEVAATDLAPAQDVLAAEVLAAPEPAPEPATAAATAPIDHPVTVVMVQPAGVARDGTTLAAVTGAVNGPVADFWAEQSNGSVRFGVVKAVDWVQSSATCSEPFGLWQDAADAALWAGASAEHLLVYVPAGSPGCAYGLGTVGTGTGSGGLSYVQATELSVMAHELGHNLGLGHASTLLCDRQVEEGGGACGIAQYYDLYDVMGVSWGPVGSLNAVHAARLGLLPDGSVPEVAAGALTAEYTLTPVGARTGTRALQLVEADGDVYSVEYRTPTGRDTWLGDTTRHPLQSGVLLRRATDDGNATSLLLDASPAARSSTATPTVWWDQDPAAAVPVGTPVTVGGGTFTVTLLEATASGARVQVAAHPIDAAYERLGGSAALGAPTTPRICGLRDGGCRRAYANGSLYWNPVNGRVTLLSPAVAERYELLAGPTWLGYPLGEETPLTLGSTTGRTVSFPAGDIVWSPSAGAHVVRGAILARWRQLRGTLGFPVGGDAPVAGGSLTAFSGGSVYWSAATGPRLVRGAILQRYVAAGGPGALGFPVADDGPTADGTGAFLRLQRGEIHWSPSTGAHVVRGAILERWRSLGAQTGVLGYPIGDDTPAWGGGYETRFTGGTLYWSPETGARRISGALLEHYVGSGGPQALGYPRTDDEAIDSGTGARVVLLPGAMYWTPSTGAHFLRGRIYEEWMNGGAQSGPYGYPVTDYAPTEDGSGHEAYFTGGIMREGPYGELTVFRYDSPN